MWRLFSPDANKNIMQIQEEAITFVKMKVVSEFYNVLSVMKISKIIWILKGLITSIQKGHIIRNSEKYPTQAHQND